jgi:Kef-type K+ transport system membrane component KefB/CBS domain-containing protein
MLPMLFTIGALYLLAIGAGRLSAAMGIPRVTGYLFVGLMAGPSTGAILGLPALISQAQLSSLGALHDIILGLIVFTIGGSFRFKAIRKIGSKLFRVSILEMGASALLVGFGTYGMGASPLEAGFLAVFAITTAPAATQMVIREYRSEGSLTDTILPLIGINNLVAILAFILLEHYGLSPALPWPETALQILAPIALGGITGIIIAVMDQRLSRKVERQMLLLGAVALTTGLALHFGLSAMLAILIAGVVAVNAGTREDQILQDLTDIDYPFYVFFFIMAGAELHLEALAHMGFIGVVYVAARAIGKFVGCRLGTIAAGMRTTLRTWLGPAMLAQAGLAIGLANLLAGQWPGPGQVLQTVILASVVVFELVGPLLTRTALVNAGEITILNLLEHRSPVSFAGGLRRVFDQFRKSLGISPLAGGKLPEDLRVAHVMRRNVAVLSHKARFHEVVKALGYSCYDRLPVINDRQELVGVIKYADIADTVFDPGLRDLVVAAEIASSSFLTLTPQDTVTTAIHVLTDHPRETHLLVVDENNPLRLVGIVSHNDLLATHTRRFP